MRIESARIGRFTADAAYEPYLRMKMSGTYGVLTVAGDEAHLGVLEIRTHAAGGDATLYHKNAPGTHCYVAAGTIAKGSQVTSAAAGKVVTGISGAIDYGIAMNDAIAGELVEVLPA